MAESAKEAVARALYEEEALGPWSALAKWQKDVFRRKAERLLDAYWQANKAQDQGCPDEQRRPNDG